MTDLFDRAQQLELQQREAALAALPVMPRRPSYSHCQECGDEIPQARQRAALGCHRCLACQTEHEKRSA